MVTKNTSKAPLTKTSQTKSNAKSSETKSIDSTPNSANNKDTSLNNREKLNLQAPKPQNAIGSSQTQKVTRIIAELDVGFGNTLYIRGKGANLNWEKGLPMRNVKANEWVWESEATFPTGEFKILINDAIYETGHNHALYCGTTVKHTPRF